MYGRLLHSFRITLYHLALFLLLIIYNTNIRVG
nr:MAG TPA: hypothetical protein [Caudoviricetes sp.]